MNLRRGLTVPECERYRLECNFTEEERRVFDLCVRDWSRIQIAEALGMSLSTVDRRTRDVKRKIKTVSEIPQGRKASRCPTPVRRPTISAVSTCGWGRMCRRSRGGKPPQSRRAPGSEWASAEAEASGPLAHWRRPDQERVSARQGGLARKSCRIPSQTALPDGKDASNQT